MKRTKLADRLLPTYSYADELFHMISHIVGGGLGVVALALCIVFSAIYQANPLFVFFGFDIQFIPTRLSRKIFKSVKSFFTKTSTGDMYFIKRAFSVCIIDTESVIASNRH